MGPAPPCLEEAPHEANVPSEAGMTTSGKLPLNESPREEIRCSAN